MKEPRDGTLELIRAICVLLVLAVLTWYITRHYGPNATKAAAVLAAVTPVLGAVVGVSIGYSAGRVKGQEGKAAAVSQGRHQLADHLLGLLDEPTGTAETVPGAEDPRVARMRVSLGTVKVDAPDAG